MRGVGIVVLVAAATAPAHADDARELVELRYTAPPECPDRAALLAQIGERTQAVRFGGGAQRVFAITVEASPDGFTGTLVTSTTGSDAVADKQLASERCDDLVSALALVTALAIDPSASSAPRPPPAPPPPPPPAKVVPPPRPAWSSAAAIGLQLDTGVTPDPLLAGRLAVRIGRDRLAFELGALAGRDSTRVDDALAVFTWLAVRPAVCWLARTRRPVLDVCVHGEVGLVRASGSDIVNAQDLSRLWLAAGAHTGASWPLSRRGFAQLQLGLSVPIVRDRYRFMPDRLIHETAAVTGWLLAGVGLRFR